MRVNDSLSDSRLNVQISGVAVHWHVQTDFIMIILMFSWPGHSSWKLPDIHWHGASVEC